MKLRESNTTGSTAALVEQLPIRMSRCWHCCPSPRGHTTDKGAPGAPWGSGNCCDCSRASVGERYDGRLATEVVVDRLRVARVRVMILGGLAIERPGHVRLGT